MEEIDIIELLKRVKEGKAPKRIELNDIKYTYMNKDDEYDDIGTMYEDENGDSWLYWHFVFFHTKIKILDKPIIEELRGEYDLSKLADMHKFIIDIGSKINEIIKHINKEEK